jgi:hypothetical protein
LHCDGVSDIVLVTEVKRKSFMEAGKAQIGL